MVIEHSGRLSAAALLEFTTKEAREGRRLAEFGAQAYTYSAYGIYVLFLFIF